MRASLRRQDGSVLITALLVMTLLMIFGFSLMQVVDTQQAESGRERTRESSFQLAEGVLNSQIFQLSSRWPGTTSGDDGTPYPTSCAQNSTAPDCPNAGALQSSFTSVDYSHGIQWTTEVRDNGGPTPDYYSDSLLATQPTYDRNDDKYLWVRASAVVDGRTRTLVALVKAENIPLDFPNKTLVAGKFAVTNNGNKVMIDTNGENNEWPLADVVVRCSLTDPSCAQWDASKGQIDPPAVKSNVQQPPSITPEALDALRARAQSDGNYFTGCPTSLMGDKPGEVVFVEDAGPSCSFHANGVYNTATTPGYLIIAKGNLEINGTATFYGLIYHANVDNSTGYLITLSGDVSIYGSIQIDGPGGLNAGSSKLNLVYDPRWAPNLQAFGTAGIVQNTFREIDAG